MISYSQAFYFHKQLIKKENNKKIEGLEEII